MSDVNEKLKEFATASGTELGLDYVVVVQIMSKEPEEVAEILGCTPADVTAWAETAGNCPRCGLSLQEVLSGKLKDESSSI